MLGLCLLHTSVFSVPGFFYRNSQGAGQSGVGEEGKEKNPLKTNVGEFDASIQTCIFSISAPFFFFSGDGKFCSCNL